MHGNPTHPDFANNGQALQSLTDLLQQRAQQFPTRTAFVFEDETGQTVTWTYAELDQRARAIASWLAERAEVGDRALLVYPAGLDFIAAFFGCIYAGVLPVPATYPKPRRPSPRLDTIADDCSPTLVLTHSSVLDSLRLDQQSSTVAALPWEATDQLDKKAPSNFQPVERTSDDLAFLQYTSGSTSEPRGVMISHGNVLHNLETIRQGFKVPPTGAADVVNKSVSWLPTYHDMGLISGILGPIYIGGTSYQLAPTSFLRRPLRWLELLSETGAQISGAPNFGYELLVQKTTVKERAALDLSQWRLAFCGAEPIHPDTLHEFAKVFAPAGFREEAFYPCYGMAEVTLLVTGGHGPDALRLLTVDRQQLRQHQAVPVESSHTAGTDFGRLRLVTQRPTAQNRRSPNATGPNAGSPNAGSMYRRARRRNLGPWPLGLFAATGIKKPPTKRHSRRSSKEIVKQPAFSAYWRPRLPFRWRALHHWPIKRPHHHPWPQPLPARPRTHCVRVARGCRTRSSVCCRVGPRRKASRRTSNRTRSSQSRF